jgi:hypothetical protein
MAQIMYEACLQLLLCSIELYTSSCSPYLFVGPWLEVISFISIVEWKYSMARPTHIIKAF